MSTGCGRMTLETVSEKSPIFFHYIFSYHDRIDAKF